MLAGTCTSSTRCITACTNRKDLTGGRNRSCPNGKKMTLVLPRYSSGGPLMTATIPSLLCPVRGTWRYEIHTTCSGSNLRTFASFPPATFLGRHHPDSLMVVVAVSSLLSSGDGTLSKDHVSNRTDDQKVPPSSSHRGRAHIHVRGWK